MTYKMKEQFKDIPWYEWLYQAWNFGSVKSLNYRSKWIEHNMSLSKSQDGYKVKLWKKGTVKSFLAHKLIAITFLWEIPKNHLIYHFDRDKYNNRVDNLLYITQYELKKNNHKFSYYQYLRNLQKIMNEILKGAREKHIPERLVTYDMIAYWLVAEFRRAERDMKKLFIDSATEKEKIACVVKFQQSVVRYKEY